MNDRVTVAVADGVADVRLNRADKMNALDPAMLTGIEGALAALRDMTGLRAIVLSGEGRAFCAGLDMASFATVGEGTDLMARSHGVANLYQHVALGWRELAVPVIAAVHGVAFGGGFQIMLGADIRITAPDTRLSIMEMKWGLVPDMAGVALWRTLVRDDVLRELTYTAREFTGEDAVRLGFATRIADDPQAQAMALAREIAARNPDAVQASKRLYNAYSNDAEALLMAESIEQAGVIRTPNQIEAVRANVEKRAPVFRDRP
jgi:enoyl-CoA hydratase/carnithine racemase